MGSMNVMKYIWPVVRRSVADYERKLRRHIGSWRVQLMERGKADAQQSETLFQQRSEELASVEKRASALQYNYEQHMDQVRDIRDSLQGL